MKKEFISREKLKILYALFFVISLLNVCCISNPTSPSFSRDPNAIWLKHSLSDKSYFLFGMAVDSRDNLVATGVVDTEVNSNYYTIKYDSNGKILWEKEYDSGVTGDSAYTLAIDSKDNIIVSGAIVSDSIADIYTIKYSPNGDVLWEKRYSSTLPLSNPAVGIDHNDNIILTGQVYLDTIDSFKFEYFLLKYDENGKQIWDKKFKVSDDNFWEPMITIDNNNDIVVTCGGDYLYVVKFDNNGKMKWKKGFEDFDLGENVSIGPFNDIFVLCYSLNRKDVGSQSHLLKLDSEGKFIWANKWGYGGGEKYEAMAVDNFGNVIISGRKESKIYVELHRPDSPYYDDDVVLTNQYEGLVDAMAIDSKNNILILTGFAKDDGYDYYIIKYTGYSRPK